MEVRGYRVYYISKNMDFNEIINMLRNSKAEKIALVIHNEQEIITNENGLKMLKGFIEDTEQEVAIITPDEKISRSLAARDFSVYSHLEALEQSEKVENNKSSTKIFKAMPLYIVGMLLILMLAGIYFLYPTITIEVKPVTDTISREFQMKGSLNTASMNREDKVLPIHEFEVTLTDKETASTTGEKVMGITRAKGVIKFINENNNAVEIPKGTVVKTSSGIKFKTIEKVKVPPLEVDYLMDVPVGMKAGQAEVKIEALVKGSKGNVNTGAINKWDKPIEDVYVINHEPTIKGKNEISSIINKTDINKMKNELEEKIKDKLISKIYKKLGGNYRIIEDEISYSKINYSFNGEVGDKIKQLEGVGTITASGFLLRNSEVDKMATYVMKEEVSDNYHLLTHGINVNKIRLEKVNDGIYNIKLGLNAQVVPKIETEYLAEKLAGKSLNKAVNVLDDNKEIYEYRIINKMNELPGLKYAIKIVVKEPESYPVMSVNN